MSYIANNKETIKEMLKSMGYKDYEDLKKESIGLASIDISALGDGLSELDLVRKMRNIESKNKLSTKGFFLGGGIYNHYIPSAARNVASRSDFLTSYTPYQGEVSQGTLQVMYEFQSITTRITGQDYANASMYDGTTSAAEGIKLAIRYNKRSKVLIHDRVNPVYIDVIKTTLSTLDIDIIISEDLNQLDDSYSAVLIQYPDFFGEVNNYSDICDLAKSYGVVPISLTTEVVSLGLIKDPASYGFEVSVLEGQSIAGSMNLSGPTLGMFAVNKKYLRKLPGRICGKSKDAEGNDAFTLTLNSREQHIRRDKATSNICTNSAHLSVVFTIHMALLGERGYRDLAQVNHNLALYLNKKLNFEGLKVINRTFFNEMVIELSSNASDVVKELEEKGIYCGLAISNLYNYDKEKQLQYKNYLLVTVTELNTKEEINNLIKELSIYK